VTVGDVARLGRGLGLIGVGMLLLVHTTAAPAGAAPGVLETYARARGAQRLELALDQFAEDATLRIDPGGRTFSGREEIRAYLQTFLILGAPERTSPPVVHGDKVTWTERITRPRGGTAVEQSVTAVVQQGRITSIAYRTGRADPADSDGLAAESTAFAGTMLLAMVLVAAGLLSFADTGRQPRSASSLRGRLLPALAISHPPRGAT
jgi:hypothetical protein